MNILSVLNTCIVINLYYKRISLEHLHPWLRCIFFRLMPRLLFLNRNKLATAAATRERIASLSMSATMAVNQLNKSKPFNNLQPVDPHHQHNKKLSGGSRGKSSLGGVSNVSSGSGIGVGVGSASIDLIMSSKPRSSSTRVPVAAAAMSPPPPSRRTIHEMMQDMPFAHNRNAMIFMDNSSTVGGGVAVSASKAPGSRMIYSAGQRRAEFDRSREQQRGMIKRYDSNNDLLLVSSGPESGKFR